MFTSFLCKNFQSWTIECTTIAFSFLFRFSFFLELIVALYFNCLVFYEPALNLNCPREYQNFSHSLQTHMNFTFGGDIPPGVHSLPDPIWRLSDCSTADILSSPLGVSFPSWVGPSFLVPSPFSFGVSSLCLLSTSSRNPMGWGE